MSPGTANTPPTPSLAPIAHPTIIPTQEKLPEAWLLHLLHNTRDRIFILTFGRLLVGIRTIHIFTPTKNADREADDKFKETAVRRNSRLQQHNWLQTTLGLMWLTQERDFKVPPPSIPLKLDITEMCLMLENVFDPPTNQAYRTVGGLGEHL